MTKDQRRRSEDAQVRKEKRDTTTPDQQLAQLDERLGADMGANKERKRLTALLASVKQ